MRSTKADVKPVKLLLLMVAVAMVVWCIFILFCVLYCSVNQAYFVPTMRIAPIVVSK